jgi:rod shape determining protein RodA
MTRGLERLLVLVTLMLATFGLVILYSAGQTDTSSGATNIWMRQLVFLTVAFVAAFVTSRISFSLFEWAAPWLYGLGIGLLALTLVLGTGSGTAEGTSSWLGIGGARIQPVEFAKLATILMLARWFAARREPPGSLRDMFTPILIASIPAMMVLMQPDLGSAMVFGGILFATLFWAGVPLHLLFFLASPVISLLLAWNTVWWSLWMIGLFVALLTWRLFILESITIYLANSVMGVIAIVAWNKLSDFQQARILTFIDPASDPGHRSFQAIMSRSAIGSGGLVGSGFSDGPLKRAGFVPEHWTDFVFSVVGEEFGFLGVMVALGLFFGLLVVLIQIARRAADPFASIVVFGVVGLMFTHIFENIGMTIGITPITGIPLPFFSYGGSFLIAIGIAIGLAYRTGQEGRASGYLES